MSSDLASLRYPVAGNFPPVGIMVMLNWAGWEGRGVRVVTKGRAGKLRETWYGFTIGGRIDGELMPAGALDRKGRVLEGCERPSLWWPVEPAKWKGRLPEPVTTVEPQQWSSRQRFQAVDDAEAADLAREMEADREAARSSPGSDRQEQKERGERRKQWWLDATLIRYALPGYVSERSAEGRIMRALAPGIRDRIAVEGIAKSTLAAAQADDVPDEVIEPFKQSPRDLDDEGVALAWFTAIHNQDRDLAEILMLAADPRAFSWREVARRGDFGDYRAAQRLYKWTIGIVWAVANGLETAGVIQQKTQLAALRERNRVARVGRA